MAKPTNPPAFPVSIQGLRFTDGECDSVEGGMTLLDYFAGQALPVLLERYKMYELAEFGPNIAEQSYIIARLMLIEKERLT